MTERITVTQPAPPGSRYAKDAFSGQIGARVPFRIEGRAAVCACTLLAASVASDGRSVVLTLEVPDGTVPVREA